MSLEIKRQILNKIKAYDRIMLFRHIRMDGDCTGSTKGMKEMLKISFPEKEILLVDQQTSEFLKFMGPDDGPVPDDTYRDALAIVLDSSERTRISNPKYALCREIIKIDHHIEADPYGDVNWVEPERSSACEMAVDFYDTFRDELKMNARAATYLFAGMVTDSGRFRFSGVTGDTLRLAALMLDQGVDTETLYANLYLNDYEVLKFKAHVYECMQRTENGVAWVRVSREMQARFGLDLETASSAISYMENIRDCLCWLAFSDGEKQEDGIRVRLRSRFMTINHVAERHHGGGHACAAGATVCSGEEMEQLIREADTAAKEYKETHEGWM